MSKGASLRDRAVVNGAPDGVSALRASVPSAWLPFRCRVKAGRARNDPEKLVTPGILYASKRGLSLTVRLFAIGWWDWHISVLLAWRTAQAIEARQGGDAASGSVHESAVHEVDAPNPSSPSPSTPEIPQ